MASMSWVKLDGAVIVGASLDETDGYEVLGDVEGDDEGDAGGFYCE